MNNNNIRIVRDNKYFPASYELFNDATISLEARGLMGYIMSKPDDTEIDTDDIASQVNVKKDVVQRIIRELAQAGYLEEQAGYLEAHDEHS